MKIEDAYYNSYLEELRELREELEAEGLPSHGSTAELREEALRRYYNELCPGLFE